MLAERLSGHEAYHAIHRFSDMVRSGMLFGDEMSFEELVAQCADLESRINARAA